MATLVSRADTKTNLPLSIRIRRFGESTNVRPLTWKCSRTPQRCGAGRHRQSAVSKGLFFDTKIVAVVASPRSPVEVTGHQVHLFVEHHCTNCKDQLLSDAAFVGFDVVNALVHDNGCSRLRGESHRRKRRIDVFISFGQRSVADFEGKGHSSAV